MTLHTETFNAVIAEAKAKAANNPRWLRAIDRAAAAIQSGELIVTTLADGALVTSPNGSYLANGSCRCKAFQHGHKECRHHCAARLMELYEAEAAKPAASRPPRITRSIERDRIGARYAVVHCDGWHI